MKRLFLIVLLVIRLLTNDGVFLNARRVPPKKQFPEIIGFIRRPAKLGRKKTRFFIE
jgi:hypothetical protein